MNTAPKTVYYLHINKGDAKGVKYNQRGGGLFTRRIAAIERGDWLVRAGKIESFKVVKAACEWEDDHVSSAW